MGSRAEGFRPECVTASCGQCVKGNREAKPARRARSVSSEARARGVMHTGTESLASAVPPTGGIHPLSGQYVYPSQPHASAFSNSRPNRASLGEASAQRRSFGDVEVGVGVARVVRGGGGGGHGIGRARGRRA